MDADLVHTTVNNASTQKHKALLFAQNVSQGSHNQPSLTAKCLTRFMKISNKLHLPVHNNGLLIQLQVVL